MPELYHRHQYCTALTLCPPFMPQPLSVYVTTSFPLSVSYEPHHFGALCVPLHHTHLYPSPGGQQTRVKEPIVCACQNGKRLSYNHLSLGGSAFLSSTHILSFTCMLEHDNFEPGTCLSFWLTSGSILRNYWGKECPADKATQSHELCILWKPGNEISNWIL